MSFQKLLIANRGEIAIRIARAAAELALPSVAIYSEDDHLSLHQHRCDEAVALTGRGPRAYLDGEQIIALAKQRGCDAIHPGYGFLSENAEFAQRCATNEITFIGPRVETLQLFGDKGSARTFAQKHQVPTLSGTNQATTLEQAKAFFQSLSRPAMVIKAVAGGGGRGIRLITQASGIESAFQRCQSEALNAFGCADVYVEQLIPNARHIEVQIVGDQHNCQIHLWERDCTLQRRQQKIVEVAPSPVLLPALRKTILDAALILAQESQYSNLGTFEFLIDIDNDEFAFIEANPRLQVEHTITEQITGVDLVKTQLQIAAGVSLKELGLSKPVAHTGFALQARINMESIDAQGNIKPSAGTLAQFDIPSGPGVRVDTFGYNGYTTNASFDSLLAKVISYSSNRDFTDTLNKAKQALREFSIHGVATNLDVLLSLLERDEVRDWDVSTHFFDQHGVAIASAAMERLANRSSLSISSTDSSPTTQTAVQNAILVEGAKAVTSPLQGTVVSVQVAIGDQVYAGQELVVLESMKMEHVITADVGGTVAQIVSTPGTTVLENALLVGITPADVSGPNEQTASDHDIDAIRPDLAEVLERHYLGTDEARTDAVAKRKSRQQRTARENIADLIDPDSFTEYGPLVIASQRARRSLDELIKNTPADGLVGGLATVNGNLFGIDGAQCIVMSYDYMVFAGTQGQKNHRKKDRLFELAEKWRLPIVIFAEGGGGRPGETERTGVSGLDCLAFWYYARLKGRCPLIAIVSGRCFAGNAVLAGCSDVIIATANSNIGMGGPAMIEGGGLGVFKPEEIGPIGDHKINGVVDVAVDDETEAVTVAKQYLAYIQGPLSEWQCADQRLLRTVIPENRLRVYDVRSVIELLSDSESVLELRRDYAPGMVTAFARVEGRAIGLVANNPVHLGGAIDSDGADKAARFVQQCNFYRIPIVFLCDTPGIMVGPDAEKTALVRHASRLFIAGAQTSVPFFCIVLRKAYGLGAQTMAGGSFKAPFFTISWPSGEFGGMGLEGAVRLGYRKEIEAIDDPQEKETYFKKMVNQMYEIGKATSVASYYELDDVIDPADTRRWIVSGLNATVKQSAADADDYRFLDTW